MLRFITALVTASLLFSCSNNSKQQLQVNKIAAEGLLQSIQSITNYNHIIYNALEQRLSEPYSAVQARLWQPKALLIKQKSDSLFNYFEWLIVELKKNAGLKLIDSKEVYDESNANAVAKTLTGANSPEKIIEKLYQYKNDVLVVDPELENQFGKNMIAVSGAFQIKENAEKNLFKSTPAFSAILLLRKFENNIKNIENQTISFCLNKCASTGGRDYDAVGILIGQSSSVVMSGEKIKIKAGVGIFSSIANPTVTIDGKILRSENNNGIIEYTFKAPQKAGKYSKNVVVEFTGEDGKKTKVPEVIEYTVRE